MRWPTTTLPTLGFVALFDQGKVSGAPAPACKQANHRAICDLCLWSLSRTPSSGFTQHRWHKIADGSYLTILPADELPRLQAHSDVLLVEVGKAPSPDLITSRAAVRADGLAGPVANQAAYDGSGVIVGIISASAAILFGSNLSTRARDMTLPRHARASAKKLFTDAQFRGVIYVVSIES